ncbi:MAG: type II secretion system protein [Verrucomicrobia bacterium]|nr:type II secretion system protein [Verrucomicrobiota bacterium]
MRKQYMATRAFTLIELLVVVGIIGLLASLLLTGIGSAKNKARRMACAHNLRQINLGLLMYIDDSRDATPAPPGTMGSTFSLVAYKSLMKNYIGIDGPGSRREKLFACPSDRFYYDEVMSIARYVPHGLWEQSVSDHSSYACNGANAMVNSSPGIAGLTLSSIREPAKTVLVAEGSAYIPWSWHQPKRPLSHENARFNNAMNMASFVDGHVRCIRIHWDDNRSGLAPHYDPPPGYDYRWSGN